MKNVTRVLREQDNGSRQDTTVGDLVASHPQLSEEDAWGYNDNLPQPQFKKWKWTH